MAFTFTFMAVLFNLLSTTSSFMGLEKGSSVHKVVCEGGTFFSIREGPPGRTSLLCRVPPGTVMSTSLSGEILPSQVNF